MLIGCSFYQGDYDFMVSKILARENYPVMKIAFEYHSNYLFGKMNVQNNFANFFAGRIIFLGLEK